MIAEAQLRRWTLDGTTGAPIFIVLAREGIWDGPNGKCPEPYWTILWDGVASPGWSTSLLTDISEEIHATAG